MTDLTPEQLAQIRARAEKPDHVTCAAGVERRDIRALLAEIIRLRDDRDRQVVAAQRLRRDVADLDAAVERLRAEVARVKADADDEFNDMMAEWESVNKSRGSLQVKNDKMRAAVQRVRDLHVRTTDYDPDLDRGGPGVTLAWCQHCASDHWPCETVRALDGES